MITVTVTGYGTYAIGGDRIDELINWLKVNSTTAESSQNIPDGKSLLNESREANNPHPAGSPEHHVWNSRCR
jgi:hypothetical protein